jgi:hypothetical protein
MRQQCATEVFVSRLFTIVTKIPSMLRNTNSDEDGALHDCQHNRPLVAKQEGLHGVWS